MSDPDDEDDYSDDENDDDASYDDDDSDDNSDDNSDDDDDVYDMKKKVASFRQGASSTKQDYVVKEDHTALLSEFNKDIISCILNECADQLYILRNINTQDNANFTLKNVNYVSIADRFMGAEDHSQYRINSTISNYEKLGRDINLVIQIIRQCQDSIQTNSKFSSLKHAVDALRCMREDEEKLIKEKEKNDQCNVELRRLCEEERLSNIHVIENTNAQIQKMRFDVEDLLVYKRYELNYYKDWEATRREQNGMSCDKNENYYKKIVEDTTANIHKESRCHMEIENYIEESKNDFLDEIQYWLKHYDEETERRETEMINLKNDVEKLVEDHNALKDKYETHKQEIEDWLEYKRKKKEKEELEALQIWAATKIQAWWRGIMFRKKLGPYRKKKGKGKDKNKGKKKK